MYNNTTTISVLAYDFKYINDINNFNFFNKKLFNIIYKFSYLAHNSYKENNEIHKIIEELNDNQKIEINYNKIFNNNLSILLTYYKSIILSDVKISFNFILNYSSFYINHNINNMYNIFKGKILEIFFEIHYTSNYSILGHYTIPEQYIICSRYASFISQYIYI